MKEIKDTKEETIVKYQAEDGTIFNNKEECIKYDNTAICVIKSRLKIKRMNAWDFCFIYEDHNVEIIKGKPEDVKMYVVLNKYGWETFNKIVDDFIKKDLNENDVTLLFSNCNDEPYRVITLNDFIERIKNWSKDGE